MMRVSDRQSSPAMEPWAMNRGFGERRVVNESMMITVASKLRWILENEDGWSWRGDEWRWFWRRDWRAITPEAYAPRLPRMIC